MTETTKNPVERIVLTGGLNIYSAAGIKAQLLQAVAAASQVELDLLKVEELDTAGLQVLVLAKREAARCGHELRLVAHSDEVREALDLCGMVGWFGDPLLIPADAVATGS